MRKVYTLQVLVTFYLTYCTVYAERQVSSFVVLYGIKCIVAFVDVFVFCSDPIKVVMIIKSAPSYFNRRDAIRETWGMISHLENMIVHYIFIIGNASEKIQNFISKENATNGDILQYIGVDDYR